MPESEPIRRRLLPIAIFVVLAHALDLASTLYVSPNLVGEWNILERHFELGIPGLIAAKFVWAFLAILGYDFYLRHRTVCYPNAHERHAAFYRYFAFGPPVARRATDRQVTWLRLGIHVGYLLVGLHVLALWAALDNMLLANGLAFLMQNLSEHGYHLMQGVIVTGLTLARFYAANHQRYCLMRTTNSLPGRPQLQ